MDLFPCQNWQVPAPKRSPRVSDPREALSRLLHEVHTAPFAFLPERSVECLAQFLSGYAMFRHVIWPEMDGFERWLRTRLFYPKDTGARWWRFIQLNAEDAYDGYELFFRSYTEYVRQVKAPKCPGESRPLLDSRKFDFYGYLLAIGQKPGLYLGRGDSAQLLASHLSGYFKGKKDANLRLKSDERHFLRFENWLKRQNKFRKTYPWYRMVEMWPYMATNSLQSFFAYFDAFLTNYGKRARGLEELFEWVTTDEGRTIRRRPKNQLPTKLVQMPETKRYWRGWNPSMSHS